jgi:hypothetical protein
MPGGQASITVATGDDAYLRLQRRVGLLGVGRIVPRACRAVQLLELGRDRHRHQPLPNIGGPLPAQSMIAFESIDGGLGTGAEYARHAFEHHSRSIVNRTYQIKIQVGVTPPGGRVRIDDWHVTFESQRFAGGC